MGFFSFSTPRNHIYRKQSERLLGTVLAWRNRVTTVLLRSIPVYCHLCRAHLNLSELSMWFARQSSASRTYSVVSGDIWISHKYSHISRDQWATHRHLWKFANCGQQHHESIGWVKGRCRFMRQNSEESFEKIMDTAVKMAEDVNIALYKHIVAKRSVYRGEWRWISIKLLPHQLVHSVTGWTL